MRAFLKKITPSFIISFYKKLKKKKREFHLENLRKQGQVLNMEQLCLQLKQIRIEENDVVMLHSSLSKIGYVEGGSETIIEAFLMTIGAGGTLAMPSFPANGFNYDYLKTNPVFDLINTPSKMGKITEDFRKMKGVKRSFHPTDPVCALGPKAELITGSHYNQLTPYNANSPFYKLCELNAKIVLLGVDFNSLTNLHTLEDAVNDFKFPVYHKHIFVCSMIDEKGEKSIVRTKCHDPKWSKKRKCNDLIEPFRNAGFLSEAKIGNAWVYILDAKLMHEWMLKNYKEKGITMYTPQGS